MKNFALVLNHTLEHKHTPSPLSVHRNTGRCQLARLLPLAQNSGPQGPPTSAFVHGGVSPGRGGHEPQLTCDMSGLSHPTGLQALVQTVSPSSHLSEGGAATASLHVVSTANSGTER